MRKSTIALLLGSVLFAGVVTASSLYAQGSKDSSGSMMGQGMMGDRNAKDRGGMMGQGSMQGGQGGMMGMMNMMTQMTKMMDQCSNMMSGGNKPNDQWRKNGPSEPEKKG